MSITREIQKRIPEIHALAVEKGWWDGGIKNRDVFEIVNNFHAEVSEAWEEYRAGRMDLWYSDGVCKITIEPSTEPVGYWVTRTYPTCETKMFEQEIPTAWKPEGFWVELADLCIRVMDCFGAYKWKFEPEDTTPGKKLSIPHVVARTLSDIVYTYNFKVDSQTAIWFDPQLDCANLIVGVIQNAESYGINLFELIDLKHNYNKTRPHRHGGKLA